MSLPEPSSRSDSTTGAGGGSGALIGSWARRRRGLWGNSAGSRSWKRRWWGREGPRGTGAAVLAARPGWGARRSPERSPPGLWAPTRARAQGVRAFRRRGAHLPLYRPGGDPAVSVTSRPPPWVEAGGRPGRGHYPKTTRGGPPHLPGPRSAGGRKWKLNPRGPRSARPPRGARGASRPGLLPERAKSRSFQPSEHPPCTLWLI